MPFHVLVLDIPSNAHILPKLGIVSELVQRGNRVSYVVADHLTDRVRGTGAEVIGYPSKDPLTSLRGGDLAAPQKAFFRENLDILRAAQEHLGPDRPDAVAYDEAAFQAGRILARTWDLPGVLLTVSTLSNDHYSYFDHVAQFVPSFRLTDPTEEIAEALAAFGLADQLPDFLWTRRRVAEFTISFVPPWFQPAHETFDPSQVVFVGPSVENRNFLGVWQPPASNLPVVLASIGGVHNDKLHFFRTVAEAFVDQPWHLVATVGDNLPQDDVDRLGHLAPNVEIHRWVSNISVLAHARAFVTHGGNGSLFEALYTATPSVIVPAGPDYLPSADTARGLGVATVVPHEELDGARVLAEVETLVNDEAVRLRLADLRERIRSGGGAVRAADRLEAYLRHS
ncbi:macrolide family glycosyltransferase [Parafrankia sp. EUN1f]|uniref:macrolide family glycosyltransferase n=1 Tax=Parafrankia sp. EUN1f TaxID=102897 RepID=UPI0002EFE717|nr:macrolide family glycosyltransferase [Parafrankia sp. EUN1f]